MYDCNTIEFVGLVIFIPKVLYNHLEPYVLKEGNELCTNKDEKIIDTLNECKVAVKYLNLYFYGIDSVNYYPKGCYNWKTDTRSYWNTHSEGSAAEYARPICKKGE